MSTPDKPVYQRLTHLRRKYRPHLKRARGPIDAVPLVDVALIILLFVMMNSAFVLQPSIPLRLPETSFRTGTRYDATVITISHSDQVFLNDERTTLQELGPALEALLRDDESTSVLIEADERVRHSTLVQVYSLAQAAGVKEVGLATRIADSQGEAR
ncbi:MAG: biopolymer transporter ExbD [Verrucomicrobia bacterium]|nr:biopolymer transporter ExbD [Verrucomicrobiota bacterium]